MTVKKKKKKATSDVLCDIILFTAGCSTTRSTVRWSSTRPPRRKNTPAVPDGLTQTNTPMDVCKLCVTKVARMAALVSSLTYARALRDTLARPASQTWMNVQHPAAMFASKRVSIPPEVINVPVTRVSSCKTTVDPANFNWN